MLGIAIVGPINAMDSNQWDYAISHWIPDHVYVVGDISIPFRGAIRLPCLGYLSAGTTVLLAPQNGARFQGDESLADFSHPTDATYIFGSNHRHLTDAEMGGLSPTHKVFIPTESHHEMHSFVAAAITLYDRSVKSGQSDY
jgi:hypothetical protein